MKTSNRNKTISHAILNLAEEYSKQERKTQYYGTDVPIYYAEIHTLKVIVENPGIYVIGLAEKLEVNKASASEIVRKLEKKGLVEKTIGVDKRSKLLIYPTDKGMLAHQNHLNYHYSFEKMVEMQLESNSKEERKLILNFLIGLTEQLESLDLTEKK